MSRRAKIVCTLGPATASPEAILDLVKAGMDVARLNLSHGDPDQHRKAYANVRAAAEATGRSVGVLADLPGPKIRLGRFKGGSAMLEVGADFEITTEDMEGDARRASTTYESLPSDVKPGDPILVDDGRLSLEVVSTDGKSVRTKVVRGGEVSDKKGLNLPGVKISAPALDARNIELLHFAMDLGVDLIAMSFVRSASDAAAAHREMASAAHPTPLIAKIEKPEAVQQLDAIVDAFDGLMVARGDLGVEMQLEDVPLTQKRAVHLARERGKPVIVATQMLESMIHSSRPTRAETSDVANAAWDGADALMLSGETSIGDYPTVTVQTMDRIICAAEADGFGRLQQLTHAPQGIPGALARAATHVAVDVGAKALVAFTTSGATVRLLASQRDATPLIVFSPEQRVRGQLSVVWGAETFVVPFREHMYQMVKLMDKSLIELGHASKGERVVLVAGTPPGTRGSTNMVRVHHVGNA